MIAQNRLNGSKYLSLTTIAEVTKSYTKIQISKSYDNCRRNCKLYVTHTATLDCLLART